MGLEKQTQERNTVGCVDTIEGTGVRGHMAGNAPRGSWVCLESEAPLLRGTWGAGTTRLPYASSCCCSYWVYPSVLQAAGAFAPTHLGKDQMPESSTHTEVGLNTKLSPKGSATKEEKYKSFYTAAQAVNKIPKIS